MPEKNLLPGSGAFPPWNRFPTPPFFPLHKRSELVERAVTLISTYFSIHYTEREGEGEREREREGWREKGERREGEGEGEGWREKGERREGEGEGEGEERERGGRAGNKMQ